MKRLFLALFISLTAIGCSRYGQHEEDINHDDVYQGVLYNSGFCGEIFLVSKINNKDIPEDRIISGIKLINLPNNILSTNSGVEIEVTLSHLNKVNPVKCGGFLGYNYEAQIKKVIHYQK